MRFSSCATELLVWVSQCESWSQCLSVTTHDFVLTQQDHMEQQWFALRFPPGGSGYIIDTELLERNFHSAQPCEAAYQSFILVFSKRSKRMKRDISLQKLREEMARRMAGMRP